MGQGAIDGAARGRRAPRARAPRALGAGVVALGLAVTFVTGCTPDDPEPTPTPTVDSPTPTPTPTVEALAPPERPAEMERSDDVGAAAAAVYFLQLFDYVMHTGDVGIWDEISVQDCGFCAGVRTDAESMNTAGRRLEGGAFVVGEPRVVGFEEAIRVHAVEVAYTSEAGVVVDASGAVQSEIAAGSGFLLLDVGYTADGWRLVRGGAADESIG